MSRVSDLRKTQELARKGVIFAPDSFINATIEDLMRICNGCGQKGSWFRPPKRMYGTLIVYACHVHDWMYSKGRTKKDKKNADKAMKVNIDKLIDKDGESKWYKPIPLQKTRSYIYYLGVKLFGGKAFRDKDA